MTTLEIFITAVALSIDASVCSVIYGKKQTSSESRLRHALSMAFTFGFFQFLMPMIGFKCGESIIGLIDEYDHWLAFILLACVSFNMLKEAIQGESQEARHINFFILLSLGIATSIDALAVGFSLGLTSNPRILYSSLVIGLVCFTVSFVSFMAGQQLSKFRKLDRVLNLLGAITLFLIGVNILHEHGVF
jgi:putative Mn2+ efflux pump MntP